MIEVKNISKSYKKKVLDNISLSFDEKEIVGIAGKNGSGKSTLIKIITSALKPDSGEVLIDGKDIFKSPSLVKNSIGYVSQENSLFDDLTVMDNFIFFSELYETSFDMSTLPKDILKTKIKDLSGGMKKRINILISLINNPKYLLMDEPTANLDIYFKKTILDMVIDYKEKGNTTIISSHDVSELQICDKIVIIKDGKIFFYDAPLKFSSKESFSEKLFTVISS